MQMKKINSNTKGCGLKIVATIVMLFFSCTLSWSHVKEEFEKLTELKEKLRQEKVARVNDKVDSYNQLKSLEMKVYSLEDKLTELKTKKYGLEEELNSIKSEREKNENECNDLESKRKEIEEFLQEKCGELKNKIENSFPYRKHERLEKLDSIKNLSQLFNILEEELIRGQSNDLYSEKINDKVVKVLKIGGIFSVYKSTDGETGFLEKGIKKDKVIYCWNKNISSGLKKNLEDIFQAIEKKEKIIRIPVDVTQGTKREETGPRTGLWGWFVKGGPVMIPIALVALAILVMAIERLWTFKREYTNADVLMDRIMALWSKNNKEDAIKSCETTPGPVARMLRVGLEQHQKGKKVVEEMLHEQHLEELPRLERYLSTIAVLAGAAPLLGLLGTVTGMINTFYVITYHGGGDPKLLAGGISEALITTEFGLIVAIPTLLLHNYLSNKADRIASDMEKNAVKLINSLPS